MTTKSITITEEAYQYLKDLKGERSFSEVILSLKRRPDDVMRFAGALKGANLASIGRIREDANRGWANRS